MADDNEILEQEAEGAAEQLALDATMAGEPPVIPPVEDSPEEKVDEEIIDPPPPANFVGDYSTERTIELLKKLEGFSPDELATALERKLGGHLGPIGERLKALEVQKDLEFDLDIIKNSEKLRMIDDGLPEIIAELLPQAIKQRSTDVKELVAPYLSESLQSYDRVANAQRSDALEVRLLKRAVPDYLSLAQKPEWVEFVQKLPEDGQRALLAWEARDEQNRPLLGLKNAEPVIETFLGFQQELKQARIKEENARKAKKEKIAANTRTDKKPSTPAPSASSSTQDIEQAALDGVLSAAIHQGY